MQNIQKSYVALKDDPKANYISLLADLQVKNI